MHAAMLVNLAIVLMVMVGLALTTNPLCIMALFFLRDMAGIDPSMLMNFAAPHEPQLDPDDDEPGQPMGFTADVK